MPPHAELTGVPFFPDDGDQCGPAVLATLFNYEGVPLGLHDLEKEVYLPARHGALQVELLAATRRAGLVPYLLDPDLTTLFDEVAAGNPVVVLQNLGLPLRPDWHYAVVVGYDVAQDEVMLRSSTARRLVLSIDEFDRTWQGSGRWAFVGLPADRLPKTAEAERYLASVAALETVSPATARAAYQTSLTHWPRNLVAQMGLGNVAYRQGDFAQAAAHYGTATRDHPGSADAWNNLALALARLGRTAEASASALKAVALGGPRQNIYDRTLREIQNAAPGSTQ